MDGNDLKRGRKNKRIGRRVGNLVALMLAVSITVVVVLCVWMFYRLTMSMMEDVCVSGTNVLAYELTDYTGPEDKTELLDALSGQMGCEFTIFHGDERAYTTILQDGQRVVGTRLSDELSEMVLERGQNYVGKASILGEDHLCSYVPTRDENGNVDGLIFAGISMADVNRQVTFTVYLSCLIGIALIIAGIFVVGAYIKRTVSKPLYRLTVLAETLEAGNLGLEMGQNMEVAIHSNDEIGILAQSFDQTISRLRNYIGEISHMLESIAEGDLTVQINQEYVGDFARIRSSLNDILEKLDRTIGQIVICPDVRGSSGTEPGICGTDRRSGRTGEHHGGSCGQDPADCGQCGTGSEAGRGNGAETGGEQPEDAGNDGCHGADQQQLRRDRKNHQGH